MLTVMVGPPAAGKTTFLAAHAPPEEIVSFDELDGSKHAVMAEVARRLARRQDVWVDMTCLQPGTRHALLALATETETSVIVLETSLAELLRRDAARLQPHDPAILLRCYEKFRAARWAVLREPWDRVTFVRSDVPSVRFIRSREGLYCAD